MALFWYAERGNGWRVGLQIVNSGAALTLPTRSSQHDFNPTTVIHLGIPASPVLL